ncbi:MAG: hypothetical protein IPK10_16010 [Bacteroidetes bacterium]|nr:hypothetical protein [Bacteroidota bacterium]
MRKLILLLFVFNSFLPTVYAQETDTIFNPNIFKYSKNDSPYSLGFGVAVGTGSLGLTAGIVADMDIYHILIGLHTSKYGYLLSNNYQEAKVNSLYLGYQYRSEKIMASISGGLGNVQHTCTSGMNYNCYGVDESKRQSKVFRVEFDVLLSTYLILGISYNSVITNKTDLNALLLCFKFGLFRDEY